MMYQMGDIQTSFNFEIGSFGFILIVISILGATIYAVIKELIQTPATLMRPKSPKMGKRVFLEKVTFIWKRLSFSRKVTVRNIFRYKKEIFNDNYRNYGLYCINCYRLWNKGLYKSYNA